MISQISQYDENARTLIRMNSNSQWRPRSSTSIFAILYERPVRRRYYRQFNRNATNLVRRLSQSRLFLNSSRTQNAAANRNNHRSHRDNNNNNNNNQTNTVQASESNRQNTILNQVETEIDDIEFDLDVDDVNDAHEAMLPTTQTQCSQNDCISVHSLNIIIQDNNGIERENQLNLNRRTFASSETDIIRQCEERIETPPPPYDIVAE